MPVVERVFRPNVGPQSAFWLCGARVVAYGGAMGGGKSRAVCEKALQFAMECPGVQVLVCRQRHTSIVETTRKTFFDHVCPPELVARSKASMGEDFCDLFTPVPGVLSRVNFVGLEDPQRWFSAEIGVLIVDQVEECSEETVVKLMTRLRDPLGPVAPYSGVLGVPAGEVAGLLASGRVVGDVPSGWELLERSALVRVVVRDYLLAGKVLLSFNPEDPGHWLMDWFFNGGVRTETGFRKAELYARGADFPFGDAEFFFARATDNPHLAPGYVSAQLAGMPEHLRRRYLDGVWEFVSGKCYFDTDALGFYQELAQRTQPLRSGFTVGDCGKDAAARLGGAVSDDPVKFRSGEGPWALWALPVPGNRYVVAVDVSSGGAQDYSGIQVVCVESLDQVAEFQGKADPDLVAQEAYRIARIFNDGLIVPEVTGGWGFSVEQELKRFRYPNLYTKKVLDRLSRKWTDRTGWDTTVKTRAHMLDTLERLLRERGVGVFSLRLVRELATFVRDDLGRPAARSGHNDDLVVAMAIACTVAVDMPRQLRKLRQVPHRPSVSAVTGY